MQNKSSLCPMHIVIKKIHMPAEKKGTLDHQEHLTIRTVNFYDSSGFLSVLLYCKEKAISRIVCTYV